MNRTGRPGSKRGPDGRFVPEMLPFERELDEYQRRLERDMRALLRLQTEFERAQERIKRRLPMHERRLARARAAAEKARRPVPFRRPRRVRV